jgi:two-component system phosphate regulon response regulator OmpR
MNQLRIDTDTSPPHILVVDDDRRLRELLKKYLSDQGFFISVASDAGEAWLLLEAFRFDLLVLDIMLPGGESGLDIARHCREKGIVTPILMLSALGETENRIEGLESGADDYLAKPFEPRELTLRIQSILRRQAAMAPVKTEAVTFGSYHYDYRQGELTLEGQPVHLTSGEQALLTALAEKVGEAVSREELSRLSIFSGNERSVDVQITRLRKKLDCGDDRPSPIQTVRGAGYLLRGEKR